MIGMRVRDYMPVQRMPAQLPQDSPSGARGPCVNENAANHVHVDHVWRQAAQLLHTSGDGSQGPTSVGLSQSGGEGTREVDWKPCLSAGCTHGGERSPVGPGIDEQLRRECSKQDGENKLGRV